MGWARPEAIADAHATPLHARAFVFREGGRRVALAIVEFLASHAGHQGWRRGAAAARPRAGPGRCPRHGGRHAHAQRARRVLALPLLQPDGGGFERPWPRPTWPASWPRLSPPTAPPAPRRCAWRARPSRTTNPWPSTAAWRPTTATATCRSPSGPRRPTWPSTDAWPCCARTAWTGAICCLSVFGVHAINVHSDVPLVHHDNKGIAAAMLERDLSARRGRPSWRPSPRALAGDVTPNFRFYPGHGAAGAGPGRQKLRGLHPDDLMHVRGGQRGLAVWPRGQKVEIWPAPRRRWAAASTPPCATSRWPRGGAAALRWRRRGRAHGARRDWRAHAKARTTALGTPPVLGDLGVRDRPHHGLRRPHGGADARHGRNMPVLFDQHRAQGAKDVCVDGARGTGLGQAVEHVRLPGWVDATVGQLEQLRARGGLAPPWTPQVLSRLRRASASALAAMPGEPTTQAGRRVARTLGEELAVLGVRDVLVLPYANAYAGYVTTHEEYDLQGYEAASTHFGRWTLGAYQAAFGGWRRSCACRARSGRRTPCGRMPSRRPSWRRGRAHDRRGEVPRGLYETYRRALAGRPARAPSSTCGLRHQRGQGALAGGRSAHPRRHEERALRGAAAADPGRTRASRA